MAQTKIIITHDKEVAADMVHQLIATRFTSKMHVQNLRNLLNAIYSGVRNASLTTSVDDSAGAFALGSITYTNFNTAADQVIVSGVTFAAVASGATGNQFNIGASAAAQATNLAAAINAAPSMVGLVTASAVGAVVTITSILSGPSGNAITLAKGTDAGTVMTVGGVSNGRLAGGSASTVYTAITYKFGV